MKSTSFGPGPGDADLLKVLASFAGADLNTKSAVSKAIGRGIEKELEMLIKAGLIRRDSARRNDGCATVMYSVTSKGKLKLNAAPKRAEAAPVPSSHLATSRPTYDGADLRRVPFRAGCMDAFRYPSRVGERLHYPGGGTGDLT